MCGQNRFHTLSFRWLSLILLLSAPMASLSVKASQRKATEIKGRLTEEPSQESSVPDNGFFSNEKLILREMVKQKKMKSKPETKSNLRGQHTGSVVLDNRTLSERKKTLHKNQWEKLSERDLYGKAIELFRAKDKESLDGVRELMNQKFPASPHIDNVIYLSGLLEMRKDQFVPALRKFDSIVQAFPNGNKRVSALFAKAVIYKRLHLLDQSETVLNQVVKEYPGSPESQRAVMELKLLKASL